VLNRIWAARKAKPIADEFAEDRPENWCLSHPDDIKNDPACKPFRPKPVRFRPWQQVWQCNDIRVTVTGSDPVTINYDIGGTIWGGINFTLWQSRLFLRGVPCTPVR